MGGFSKWKKLEEAHGRDTSYYENDTRSQEEIIGYSLASPDTYTAADVAERLRNYYDNPARQAARRATRSRYVSPKINEDDDDEDEDKAGELGRIRNWFSQRANSGSERNSWADRIVAHNAQAEQAGIQPMYDANDAASAYFGYMQLPEDARDKQLEEYYRTIHEGSQANLQARVEAARQQEAQKSVDWFAEQEAKYSGITSRPDFAQNSVGWEGQTGYAGQITENTPEAEAYRNYLMYTPDNMRDPELEQQLREAYEQSSRAHADESIPMTDEEKQVYQYLLNTEGEEAAQDYYDYISYAVNERQMDDLMQQAAGNTETGIEKTLASIGSVPAKLIGGAAGVVDILKQNVRNRFGEYRPVDYNSGAQQLANYGQAVRENTMEDMGNVGQFLYGTGMSMADSLASIAVGGQAGGVLLGLSAAQSAVQDAHERGATDTQALASGIFAGTAEMVFERIGIDNLFKVANAGMTDSVRNIVKGIVSQMLAEGSEEVGTTIANTITDALIMADKSALNTAIAEYEAQGMSHEEATRQAWRDWAKNLAMDFLGGAVSGGVMGGGAQAIGTYGAGRAIQKSGQAQDVVDYASQFGSDAAKALAQRASTGDNASAMQLGRMFSNIENPVTTADGGVDVRATIDRRIAQLEQETAQREAAAARRKAQAAAAPETAQEAPTQTAEEVVEQEQKPTQAAKTAANTAQETPASTAKKTRAMTVRDAKGNSVELVDVTTGQDENLAFVTADGKQISVDDVNFDGAPKAARIAEYAGRMNVDGARGLVANYDGGDAVAYARPYTVIYERAKRNVSMQDAVRNIKGLSEAAIQAAYTAGQVERMANEGTQESRGGVIRSFTSSISETKERALEVLDAMASAIGRTLVVTDTINYVAADGTVRTSGSNAQFDPKTNRYTIALDAVDESYINVFAHETVHDIETNSPEDFALLREVVFDWLEQSGEDIEQKRQVQRDLTKGYDDAYYDAEIVANSVAAIFGERKTFRRFMDEFMNEDSYSHEHRRVFMELVDSVLEFIQKALDALSQYRSWSQIKALRQQRDMIEAVRDAYFAGLKNAVQQEASGQGDTRNSFVGYDPETGRGIYESNFPKGTPKSQKGQRILEFIQNVWSKKPIPLTVVNDDGTTRTIYAQFDPTYDEKGRAPSDATKLMGGNRHGTASEQRVTLDLADDYYQIASEAKYGSTKAETGKTTVTHQDVKQWHYFINDILFVEYGSSEMRPYRVTINVKERDDGSFVYSYNADAQDDTETKQRPSTRQTLHADVTSAQERGGNARPMSTEYTERGSSVNRNIRSGQQRNSLKDDTYMSVVEEGDMETAQRMVDEAARDTGYTVRAYHGTRRANRVGTVFLPERATSGPMAYFTDNRDIAERYSRDKQDTSIAYDPDFDQYETQFRAKIGSSDVALYTLWNRLPIRARQAITRNAEQLRQDWDNDDELILDPDTNEANGGFQWQLREARGNTIKALIEQWLNSGTLYNQEADFMDVLEMAGVTKAVRDAGLGEVYFKDPDARYDKVYDTYLKITKPFDTATVDEAFVDDLVAWYEENDEGQWDRESMDSDPWDKNNIDAYEFADRVREDIERGTTRAWTSIPDSVTDYLKSLGHDGIKDAGGKNGGESHTVWIPFTSDQVKSAEPIVYDDNGDVIPLSQRFNPEQQDIRYSAKDTSVDVEALQAENAQLRAANAEMAAQMRRSKTINLDERAIRRFAKQIVEREGSTFNADQLAERLSGMFDYMVNADVTDEDAMRIIESGTALARQVLEQARYFDQARYDADSAVREFLRDTAVEIPAEYDDAVKRMTTSRTAYRKQTRGVLNIVGKGKGVSIDQLWQSGNEDFPTVFSENVTNPEDMVEELFVLAQGLQKDAYFGDNPYANDLDTAANILFLEMQAELMNIPRVKTLADRAAEAAKANRRAERVEKRLTETKERYAGYREGVSYRRHRDRVLRKINELYQWTAKPNSKNYVPETFRVAMIQLLRAFDLESRAITQAPKMPTHPGENATAAQLTAYKARMTTYNRQLAAYNAGKTTAQTTQSLLWETRMEKLADEIERACAETSNSVASTIDPDLPSRIREFLKNNPHLHIASMNSSQLRQLSDLLNQVTVAVRAENKRHAEYREMTIQQTADATKAAARERERINSTKYGQMAHSNISMVQMDAMNTAHMLGGGAESIIQELRDGMDVYIEHIDEALDAIEPITDKLDMKLLRSTKVKKNMRGKYTEAIVLHSMDGDLTLTRAQVMSLYCLNRREQARGHLYGGGIVSTRDGKKIEYRLTEQQVNEACSHLTQDERNAAEALQEILSTMCSEWGNEATMELYGYKKFTEAFYFPISTAETSRDQAYDPQASETTIAQRGFSQTTQENATNAIYIGDILTVTAKHVADMAEYGAYLVRISDAMRWLNFRGKTEAGYVNVRAELQRAYPGKEHKDGSDADKSVMSEYITNLIRSINGGGSRTSMSTKLTRLAKGAAVGANLSVALQQPASYARAGSILPAWCLAAAKPAAFVSEAEFEQIQKYCPIVRWKGYGFFQAGSGKNIESLIRGDSKWRKTGITGKYRFLHDKQGILAEVADRQTWKRLWVACKLEQKRLHPDMDVTSEEFLRLVGKRLSEVVDRTQVVDSPFHRAGAATEAKWVTLAAFQSEVFKSYGVLNSSLYDVALNPKSKSAWQYLGKSVVSYEVAQVLAGILAAIPGGLWRDKDEEKGDDRAERWLIERGWIEPTGKYTRGEKFLVRSVENILSNVNPLRLHFIGNKVLDVFKDGFSSFFTGSSTIDNSFFDSVSKLIAEGNKVITKLRQGEEVEYDRLIQYGLQVGSYGFGLGVYNAWRDAKGIWDMVQTFIEPETYLPTMDDVFYYAEAGVDEEAMAQVLAAETATVQEKNPAYSADKAEREARGNLRGEITDQYKDAYVQAFIDGDRETMQEIRSFMADTGLYIDDDEPSDACERWLWSAFKADYLAATTDEERKEARENLWRSGYYDTRAAMNSAIRGWTE